MIWKDDTCTPDHMSEIRYKEKGVALVQKGVFTLVWEEMENGVPTGTYVEYSQLDDSAPNENYSLSGLVNGETPKEITWAYEEEYRSYMRGENE